MAPRGAVEARARCWARTNGRLVKVEEEVVDREVTILTEDNSEAIRCLIVQKDVQKKARFRNKCHQEAALVLLPNELKVMVVRDVSARDVAALAGTCKALREFVTQTFVPSVILPLSEEVQARLAGRAVLALTSTVQLAVWRRGGYMAMVTRVNLKEMKRLRFGGPNFRTEQGLLCLPEQYLQALEHFVALGSHLEAVDILVDNSPRLLGLLRAIAAFPRLQEVTLRSSGNMGRTLAAARTSVTVNRLLAQILANTNIKKLTLKGFEVAWGGGDGEDAGDQRYERYRLDIASPSLETLRVEFSKTFVLGRVEAARLREVEVSSSYWGFCLFHADQGDEKGMKLGRMGQRAPALARGCPALRRFNDLDLGQLREEGRGDWLGQLERYKGRGCDMEEEEGAQGSCHMCRNTEDWASQAAGSSEGFQ